MVNGYWIRSPGKTTEYAKVTGVPESKMDTDELDAVCESITKADAVAEGLAEELDRMHDAERRYISRLLQTIKEASKLYADLMGEANMRECNFDLGDGVYIEIKARTKCNDSIWMFNYADDDPEHITDKIMYLKNLQKEEGV